MSRPNPCVLQAADRTVTLTRSTWRLLGNEYGVPAVPAKPLCQALLGGRPPPAGRSANHDERQRGHGLFDGVGCVPALTDPDGHRLIELACDAHRPGGLPFAACRDQQHDVRVAAPRERSAGREGRTGAVRCRGQHVHCLESHESKLLKPTQVTPKKCLKSS